MTPNAIRDELTENLRIADIQALADYFAIWWYVLVLSPNDHRHIRGMFVDLGFVRPRGKLTLTARGKRIIGVNQGRKL